MGKVRQIFVWNGSADLGPFRREELIEQLKAGTVLPSDFYWEEGMSDWAQVAALPCCRVILATEAQKSMLDSMGLKYGEFLTKAEVSSIMENQPATNRQLAFLEYLDIPAPGDLTKTQASEMIEEARTNPSLGARFDRWFVDRLDAYPELYATERLVFKAGRASELFEEYERFRADLRESGVRFPKITLAEVEGVVPKLDARSPGWDKDIRLTGVDFLLAELEREGRVR